MVDRLHREVEGHEFDNRPKPAHCCSCSDTGKTVFGNRRVDDTASPEFSEESLGDLVGALIFGDFFAHHKDARVAAHFLCHCIAQRFTKRDGSHAGVFVDSGLGFGHSWRSNRCNHWNF